MPAVEKRLIVADRRRAIGRNGFGWIDRKLVDGGFIDTLDGDQTRLYLFLAIVSDRDGLSFYGDRRIARSLRMTLDQLDAARRELQRMDLVAYRAPLYQVLSLPGSPCRDSFPPQPRDARLTAPTAPEPERSDSQPTSFAQILAQVAARVRTHNGGDAR